MRNFDEEQERQEAIESKQEQVFDDLISGELIYLGDDVYSMDDFVADVEIDVTHFCAFMDGDGRDLRSQMTEKLNELAEDLATKIIDMEVQHGR